MSCNPESGRCAWVASGLGQPCDDGNICTTEDSCGLAFGIVPACLGNVRDCTDQDPCTLDWCHPARDCLHLHTGRPTTKAKLVIRKPAAPPGDEAWSFKADVIVAGSESLSPAETGVRILVQDSTGGALLDLVLDPGALNPFSGRGWTAKSTTALYTDLYPTLFRPVRALKLQNLSQRTPGLVRIQVQASRGSFLVRQDQLPLRVEVVLDPERAVEGACTVARFRNELLAPTCSYRPGAVTCR